MFDVWILSCHLVTFPFWQRLSYPIHVNREINAAPLSVLFYFKICGGLSSLQQHQLAPCAMHL